MRMNSYGNLWQLKSTYEGFSERVFWPVGTVEAHGPLPVGTDNISARYIAEALAEEFGADVLPLLPFGVNRSLYGHRGNLSVSPETFKAVIYDIGRSLKENGVKELILINGHGGNTPHIKEVLYRLHRESGLKVASLDWWAVVPELSEEVFGEVQGHGGVEEAAFVLVSYPDILDRIKERRFPAYHPRQGVSVYPSPRSILLYRPGKTATYGITVEDARRYVDGVLKAVSHLLREIISGWEELP